MSLTRCHVCDEAIDLTCTWLRSCGHHSAHVRNADGKVVELTSDDMDAPRVETHVSPRVRALFRANAALKTATRDLMPRLPPVPVLGAPQTRSPVSSGITRD